MVNRKREIWLVVLVFLLVTAAVPFWSFNKIENNLNDAASMLDSFKSLESAEMEWNGRNCYLIVPGNMNEDAAEAAAEDIEAIQGVRDVTIIYDDSIQLETNDDENETEVVIPQKSPGSFVLEWTEDSKDISGNLDEDSAQKVEDIFIVEGITIDDGFAISEDMINKLESIGVGLMNDLSEGRLEVDGNKVKISGTVADPDNFDNLNDGWSYFDWIETDLKMPEDENEDIQNDEPIMIQFDNIEFDFAALTITSEAGKILDEVAQVLDENEDIVVDIIGHTDATGTMSTNQYLSEKRAEVVRDALIARGIDSSRMTVYGMGETMPIDDSRTDEADQMNRRVEIIAGGNN